VGTKEKAVTSEEQTQKNLDQISMIVEEAVDKAVAFYDCRLVLGVLLGRTSALAAALRQTGVLDHRTLVRYFMAGLENSFVDGKVPKLMSLGDTQSETKQ
jgi:hypothetical protein